MSDRARRAEYGALDGQIGRAMRSRRGDPHCGDACTGWRAHGRVKLCMVDGLGHGQEAEAAALAALAYVGDRQAHALAEVFAGCDEALRETRGAAMGIAIIEEATGRLSYAGVGNTRALVAGARTIRLPESRGIVGGGFGALCTESTMLRPGALVVMATDGIAANLDIVDYDPTLWARPQGLADLILRDWRHNDDDAAVLVFRFAGM